MTTDWKARAGTHFVCEKRPATGTRGMVVTNHPLASAAGAEMIAAGGNAVDGAIAALFTLTVVEPMMVGLLGGGMAHLRLPDGTHTLIDGMATCAAAARPDMFTPGSDNPRVFEAADRSNVVGGRAVLTPGNLKAWCEILARFGRFPLADVMAPAIRHAERGFLATPYLSECAAEAAPDMRHDKAIAALYVPEGEPLRPGHRVVQSDYAQTLRTVAREGAAALDGALGTAVAAGLARAGGFVTADDLRAYRTIERAPLRGRYRDVEVVMPPPPAASGVHVLQMLNILSAYDLRAMGFGSADTLHLLAECLKIAFADRAAASGDPAFIEVPVARLTSMPYADDRRALLDMARAQAWSSGLTAAVESANTTHVTVADGDGRIACMTQTINSTFGARFIVDGTGMIPNNYMATFDPRPGKALSIAPGKRVTTSMSPTIVLRDGKPAYALGMPGGLRIFGSVMQGVLNLVDHGMSLQEAVEAPRIWTQGEALEVEPAVPAPVRASLAARGHDVARMPHIGGGMGAVAFREDGAIEGAACWRADGTAIGVGGGLAREGVRFWPDAAGPRH